MLESEDMDRSFPVKAEIPTWYEIRVWMSQHVGPTYDAPQH